MAKIKDGWHFLAVLSLTDSSEIAQLDELVLRFVDPVWILRRQLSEGEGGRFQYDMGLRENIPLHKTFRRLSRGPIPFTVESYMGPTDEVFSVPSVQPTEEETLRSILEGLIQVAETHRYKFAIVKQ